MGNQKPISLREYKEKHKEQVIRLVSDCVFEIFGSGPENTDDLKDIKREFFERDGMFWVAEFNREVVGTVGVFREDEKTARLRRFFVKMDFRNKGIGQMLMDKALSFCKEKGFRRIVLTTYAQMKEAIRFYKKNSFTEKDLGKKILFEKNL